MTSLRYTLILLLCLAAVSCGKQVVAPTEPLRALVPPVIVATQPPARSTGVLYDSDIWVQFDRALDSSTVNVLNVYLKQDTRRLAVTVRYEGPTHRVIVQPLTVLDLQKTFTVELSPRIRAFQGDSLGERAFFQFTTNSLRRPRYDFPLVDAKEGPVTSLGWSGNGVINGNISYECYASSDSAAVAARSVPYLQRAVFLYLLPRVRWPQGTNVFWSVTAINLVTGERLAGAVTRFRTYAADAPVDSVSVGIQDWGGRSQGSIQQCSVPLLSVSPAHNAAIRFSLATISSSLKVASARVELPVPDAYMPTLNTIAPVLHFAQNDWLPCAFSFPGPPYPEVNSLLATGAACASANRAVFEGDAIGAFAEGQARRLPYYGFILRSPSLIQYGIQPINGATARVIVYFYPPGTDAAVAAR
ncbi:MAG: Ig-like domain-containing protein [Candidatus Eisenbacteria bacterium]